jgi:nicotinate-nucleotide pyrophosphorylase (carboxylating)
MIPLMYEAMLRNALLEDLGRAGDLTSDAIVPKGRIGSRWSTKACR